MPRHVQLNNVEHANIKIRTDHAAELGDAVMSCPAFPHEFRSLQAYYPIVFSKESSGQYRPVALFGLEEGSNLFLSENGWDADYIPLAVRMQPFLIGIVSGDDGGEDQLEVHIDIEHPRVSETQGEPVFLDHGGHSEFLQGVSELLSEVHQGEMSVTGFSTMLEELGLVEPFSLDVELKDGTKGRLAGLYTINEEVLYGLDNEALGRLQATGMLQAIYMAVASMSQFRPLIERANRRTGAA